MKMLSSLRNSPYSLFLLLLIYSCTENRENVFFSYMQDFEYKNKTNNEYSIYLFIDFNSCGTCLDMIKDQLGNENYLSNINLVLIEGQKGFKTFRKGINLKETDVIFIPEELFVEFNEGYGFFMYFYFENELVKRIDLNTLNVENSFSIASLFYSGVM